MSSTWRPSHEYRSQKKMAAHLYFHLMRVVATGACLSILGLFVIAGFSTAAGDDAEFETLSLVGPKSDAPRRVSAVDESCEALLTEMKFAFVHWKIDTIYFPQTLSYGSLTHLPGMASGEGAFWRWVDLFMESGCDAIQVGAMLVDTRRRMDHLAANRLTEVADGNGRQ